MQLGFFTQVPVGPGARLGQGRSGHVMPAVNAAIGSEAVKR